MNDINNLNMNGLMGLVLGSDPVFGAAQEPTTSAPAAPGEGFQDLLGLVSDMQVADEQGNGQEELLSSELPELRFEGDRALENARNLSALQMSLPLVATPVPAQNPVPSETLPLNVGRLPQASETIGASELVSDRLDLSAKEGLVRSNLNPQRAQVKAEAVAAWTTALASGDVKALELGGSHDLELSAPLPAPSLSGAERLSAETVVVPASASLIESPAQLRNLKGPAHALDQRIVDDRAPLKASATREPLKAVLHETLREAGPVAYAEKSSAPMEAAPVAALVAETAVERTERPTQARAKASSEPKSEADRSVFGRPATHSSTDAKPAAHTETAEAVTAPLKPFKRESVSAKDFLLERSDVSASTESQAVRLQDAKMPALAGAATLATDSQDQRISGESVKFVADRIASLKAQGGGQIRMELTPQKLGAIEVRVSVVRGQVQVKISAENPETLKALQGSKSELMSKLETARPAQLELATLRENVAVGAPSWTNSEQLLGMKSVSALRQASEMHSDQSGGRAQDGFSTGGEQRQERREQSRGQWKDLQERASA